MIRTMKQYGRKIPKKYRNRPRFQNWMSFYLLAFSDLENERSFGMTPGPIPVSAIFAYCDRYGFDEFVTRDLIYFIRRLDNEYLSWCAKESKKGSQ